jgi:protein-S-isoprenylcysteine O-methyltransferase Ste14
VFSSEAELLDYVKNQLDTKGNRKLMAFGKDIFPDIDITITDSITKLKNDGNIKIGETIKLTEKGEELLGDTVKRLDGDGMKYLKMIGSILWYMVEFIVLYFGIRYLSGLIGATMLWQEHAHTLNVFGLSLEVGNLAATGVGMFMYVFGRYHFTRVSKEHRHIKGNSLLTTGYYKKSRHPMYGMMVTMQIGILSAVCFRWAAIISVIWFGVMYFNAVYEEKSLVKEHGDRYIDYKKTAKNRLFVKAQFILIVVVLLNNIAGIFKLY